MRPRRKAQSQYLLARQILELVRENRTGRERHLVETALAERLGVSRTLVRAALKLLAGQKIVEPRPNQGFFLIKAWNELDGASIEIPPTLEDDLYRALVCDRLDGNLPPRITQVALIERYRVDRSVLLRVLARMSDEGIVAKNKGHGWTFLPAIDTSVALQSSYDFRLVLEPAGVRLSTFRVDQATLDRMRAGHLAILDRSETESGRGLYEIDAEFHEMLASFTRNSFFVQSIQQQNRQRRLLEYQGYSNRRRVRDWVKEHLAVIDALRADKIELAAERLALHLRQAHRAASLQRRSSPAARKRNGAVVAD